MFSFGLVVIARVKHQIPFRTPWLSTVAPIVLRLKAWESRSLPNLKKTHVCCFYNSNDYKFISNNAGWSSLVAHQAHNLKAAGSNPAPATKLESRNELKHDD